jgi:hypothetical protein
MNRFYALVAARALHRCEYYRAPEFIFNFQFEVEHIHPLSLGGLDALINLALACTACNLFKAAQLAAFDELTQTLVNLFNPRLDRWEDHFVFEPASATTRLGKLFVFTVGQRRYSNLSRLLRFPLAQISYQAKPSATWKGCCTLTQRPHRQ